MSQTQPARTTFSGTNPFTGAKVKPVHFTDVSSITICSDPVISRRIIKSKFNDLFDRLKCGQCLKVKPIDAPKVANAMRDWIKAGNRGGKVSHVSDYGDGMGRVWWLAD